MEELREELREEFANLSLLTCEGGVEGGVC